MAQVSSAGLEVLRDTFNTPSREAAEALQRWLHSFLVVHPISVSSTANNVGSYLLLVPVILGGESYHPSAKSLYELFLQLNLYFNWRYFAGLALVHQLWATKFWLLHSRRLAQARYMVVSDRTSNAINSTRGGADIRTHLCLLR